MSVDWPVGNSGELERDLGGQSKEINVYDRVYERLAIYQEIFSSQIFQAFLGSSISQLEKKPTIVQLFLLHTARVKGSSTAASFTDWFLAVFGPLIVAGENTFGPEKTLEAPEPPTKKIKIVSKYCRSVELFDKVAVGVLQTPPPLEASDAHQDAQRTTKADSVSADASGGTARASEFLSSHIVAPSTSTTLANAAPTASHITPIATPAVSIPISGTPAAAQATPTNLTLANALIAPQNTHILTPTTSISIPAAPTTSMPTVPLRRTSSEIRPHEAPEAGHVSRVKAMFARTAPPATTTFSPRLDPKPHKMPGAWPNSPKRRFRNISNN
ncbi:hypothetical protein C8R46DRAFT_1328939 [Mycena filopes]|nr:hypothetical protein C8R46DRAFT_1328939 [Mycena filopes]